MNGKGEYIWKNGRKFIGKWINNKRDKGQFFDKLTLT